MHYILNLVNKVYNSMRTETLVSINISFAHEVFHDDVIFFTWDEPQLAR